mmetsp:Transcript_5350/g.13196  ORF Transcript_5350/g.13196 Transcript_5350/m.13196 type:complete len:242 (+) Transcript_5350:553-1278(+)
MGALASFLMVGELAVVKERPRFLSMPGRSMTASELMRCSADELSMWARWWCCIDPLEFSDALAARSACSLPASTCLKRIAGAPATLSSRPVTTMDASRDSSSSSCRFLSGWPGLRPPPVLYDALLNDGGDGIMPALWLPFDACTRNASASAAADDLPPHILANSLAYLELPLLALLASSSSSSCELGVGRSAPSREVPSAPLLERPTCWYRLACSGLSAPPVMELARGSSASSDRMPDCGR